MKPVERTFQGARLRQARLIANMTATDLAERLEVSRQLVSAAENGKPLGLEKMAQAASLLGVSIDYFYSPVPTELGGLHSAINYRSLKRTPEFQKDRADAALAWAREVVLRFSELLEMPVVRLPEFPPRDPEELSWEMIEEISRSTRQFFGLGYGPIDKLVLLLENHGIVVGYAELSEDMDGVSAWYESGPIILVKKGSPAVRSRFDIAHELGHLILHRHLLAEDVDDPTRHDLMEKQAHYFAGAFLLPEEGFVPEAVRIDLDYLVKLKRRWKVSLQAMMMRLESLHVVTRDQLQRFFQNLSRRRWRKDEPLDSEISAETPVLFERAGRFLAQENVVPFHEAFTRTRLSKGYLEVFAGLPSGVLNMPSGLEANVVQFRRRDSK
ncbi:XRE family transcriptional regulator [Pseudoxanthomonas sp. Root65]|uniref:helix-turn-helix domain-containing protein n=1 Tax=Pseudoxanthomonas sp. Root65 TaxID=1736576 RepID=UPI0012E3F247|nr:XRE family transcriptional regulator [Pseudoxanthomonas sp. Root65]